MLQCTSTLNESVRCLRVDLVHESHTEHGGPEKYYYTRCCIAKLDESNVHIEHEDTNCERVSSSVAGHGLSCTRASCEHCLDVHGRIEDEVADRSTQHDGSNEVCLQMQRHEVR